MNIAGIIPHLNSQGGAEKYFIRLYEILKKKHDITIYTISYDKKLFPEVQENVVELGDHWFYKKTHSYKESAILQAIGMKTIEKKISKNHEIYNSHVFPANFLKIKPNIYTCQEPPRLLYDLMQETLRMRHGQKQIIQRAYFPILRKWDTIETNKNADIIIVNSEYSKEYISKIYKKPIKVIFPGVENKYFKIKNKPENNVIIVGRLTYAKRIDLGIKAFAKSENKDLKLKIIGIGPEEQNLRLLTKKLGLSNVIFMGQVNETELMDVYAHALAVLYTPIREMFGIVPIEAMAAGIPVIAINEGGPKETVINDKTGYLVKANENDLAEKINKMKNIDIRTKMSKYAREIAIQFSWDNVAQKMINIFKLFL